MGYLKNIQFSYLSISKSGEVLIIFRSTVQELVNYHENFTNFFLVPILFVPNSLALYCF
jgi:hypothetical protein